MYLHYEQVASSAVVKTTSALNPPPEATGVDAQAETEDIRYTMDGATNPTAATGMLLKSGAAPIYFLIEDLKRIRFIQSGTGGKLNLHYSGGRDI